MISHVSKLQRRVWASAGEEKRGTCPPCPAKIVSFSTFLKENSILSSIFRQMECFCPPPPLGKKSANAHDVLP